MMSRIASCLAFAVLSFGLALAQNKTPVSDADFMNRTNGDLIQTLHLRPLGTSTDMERQIAALLAGFHLDLPATPTVWVCNGCGTASHPTLGIIVDLGQIAQIRQQSKVDNLPALLAFVIGHEAAHQLQFARYGKSLISLPPLQRQFYEAQADILGGAFLNKPLSGEPDADAAHSRSETLQAVYNLGGEQYALADHPSKSGRLIAASLGSERESVFRQLRSSDPRVIAGAQQYVHQLDLRAQDDDLSYSLRMARMITQYNSTAARDLAYISRENAIRWDTRAQHPVVDYVLHYENRGAKALTIYLQVGCLGVRRSDPENILQMLQASANYHQFQLQPGTSYDVTGELQWLGTDDVMPRIIYPPNPMSLIEVHYADGSDNDTPDSAGAVSMLGVTTAGQRAALSSGLNSLITASVHGAYSTLRAGAAQGGSGDLLSYPSYNPLSGSLSAEISLATGKLLQNPSYSPSITNIFTEAYDQGMAQSAFNDLVQATRAVLPQLILPDGSTAWRETKDDDHGTVAFNHDPYSIVVQDDVLTLPTGPNASVDEHRVGLVFSGLLAHPSASTAGSPFTDPSGGPTALDADLAHILQLADALTLSSLKGAPDDDSDPSPADWPSTFSPQGMGACRISIQDGVTCLNCSIDGSSHAAGNALVRLQESALMNAGAKLDYASLSRGDLRILLRSRKGARCDISTSSNTVSTSCTEWAP
jgi:hypothetical protein